jgi:hypothetical protein
MVLQDALQHCVYAALRAQQALLDGDHGLCWRALQQVRRASAWVLACLAVAHA